MKNVIITLDEEVVRRAEVWAAKNNTSMSRILGDTRKEKMRQEATYAQAQKDYFAREAKPLKSSRARYPRREKTYGR